MGTLFGYGIEPGFDIAQEQRRSRFGWPFFGGTGLCLLYLTAGLPFPTQVFQGFFATSLFYGENFYVRRGNDLGKVWLWKALFATLPFHVLYLAAIFWSDRAFPQLMTKAIAFIPILALGFAIESIQMQKVIEWCKPRDSA